MAGSGRRRSGGRNKGLRKSYFCIEDSIADHSAYLLGAMNGKKLRYDGLKGRTDYGGVQFCPVGVYTIVEVKAGKGSTAGWGRLKSGIGWLGLEFCQRI